MKNVTYYFGFINNGPPGNVEISGCQGFNQTVWAETGERFWVEAPSGVFNGDWGGLSVTLSMESNSFAINVKREYNFVPWGCMAILSPEITSYGIASEGLAGTGIVLDNQDNVPNISYNNVYGNPGDNYIFSDSVETKSAQVFDLTGTNGNISGDPLIDESTYELQEGSPCIDAGTNDITGVEIATTDYFGNPRILNSVIDIGAMEFQSGSVATEEYVSICQGEEYEGWTESGEYQRTLPSSSGADSIVTTYLTVNLTYETEEYISICEGEDYQGYTTGGAYALGFETLDGCDSIHTIHLTVYPLFKPTFGVNIDTLTSDEVYSAYQWYDENGALAGAINPELVITKSGDYTLEATNENGCTYSSDPKHVIYTYVDDLHGKAFSYSIVPNPNKGVFDFRILSDPPQRIAVKLINALGQIIEERKIESVALNHVETFDLSGQTKGIYYFVVTCEEFRDSRKIVID